MMEILEGKTIQGESLQIDDKCFINCTIEDCVLEYSGRPVKFERTHFRRCSYVFFGKAKRTVHFLQGTGLMPFEPSNWSDFPLEVN